MGRQARRAARRRSAELAPEDLFVPQDTKVNEEWARDNSLFNYRMARQGLPGRLYVWSIVAFLVVSLVGGAIQWLQSL